MKAAVPEMLRAAAALYEERNKLYGDNYKTFGSAMVGLFPAGLRVESKADWNRLGILVQMVAKFTRYCNNFNNGGHDDSLQDLAVYTTMLRELDSESLVDLRHRDNGLTQARSRAAARAAAHNRIRRRAHRSRRRRRRR